MKTYEYHWVLPLDGDPLPNIGSGLHRVEVWHDIKRNMVHVRHVFQPEIIDKIPLTRWEGIAHIPDTGHMELQTIITRLRRFYLSPCGKGDCNV